MLSLIVIVGLCIIYKILCTINDDFSFDIISSFDISLAYMFVMSPPIDM